jgi:hypothetical protein
VRLALCWLNPHLGGIQGAVMIEPEFERLSRQIGLTFYDIAFDLTCRIAVRLLLRGLF